MAPARYIKRTGRSGFSHGVAFDDMPDFKSFPNSRITKIVVMHGSGVDSMQVYYTPHNNAATKHGGGGGGKSELVLGADEFITTVTGSTAGDCIAHLTFVTNKRTWGPLGHPRDRQHTFTWNGAEGAPAHLARNIALISFSGSSSRMLAGLQATFTELPRSRESSGILNYEGGTSGADSPTVSQFAFNLMSPTVSLSVGRDSIRFHANENLLCQLPFFRAALKGEFKEAQEKSIKMPEDSPTAIPALIEYLYTGKYTYSYDPKATQLRDGSLGVPFGSLAEGLFHVGVCAAATKYDCPTLVREAWTNFQAVLGDLTAIDRLRLWKAAYSEGLQFPDWEGSLELRGTEKEMREWVKGLFRDHRKEMETTVREDPGFGCDLLRLATS